MREAVNKLINLIFFFALVYFALLFFGVLKDGKKPQKIECDYTYIDIVNFQAEFKKKGLVIY
ncbi:hypothetical protein J8655_03555 [Dickeya oryzae]|uniref:hypothetical protein n=1 Tax=Dickeya oryzae TaxID=1240404 RepID=UPI001AECEA88|nr:hypothetical protein [Dickeya oryzae]MBP2844573.1 hypothetical protein [Dickeya oryzae]